MRNLNLIGNESMQIMAVNKPMWIICLRVLHVQ
jgi:hypothetical protein